MCDATELMSFSATNYTPNASELLTDGSVGTRSVHEMDVTRWATTLLYLFEIFCAMAVVVVVAPLFYVPCQCLRCARDNGRPSAICFVHVLCSVGTVDHDIEFMWFWSEFISNWVQIVHSKPFSIWVCSYWRSLWFFFLNKRCFFPNFSKTCGMDFHCALQQNGGRTIKRKSRRWIFPPRLACMAVPSALQKTQRPKKEKFFLLI